MFQRFADPIVALRFHLPGGYLSAACLSRKNAPRAWVGQTKISRFLLYRNAMCTRVTACFLLKP